MRPLRTWYVKEDPNANIEIARLEAEIESLVPHTPDVLREVGLEVGYLPIFCCMDGEI